MNDKKAQFLPFHAINEFMLLDYRMQVISTVFLGSDNISGASRGRLNSLTKQLLQVPGFRNAAQAPAGLKARNSVKPFEKSPEFTAQVLQCWAEIKKELANEVYDLLIEKGWEILPVDTNRTAMPGFIPEWPEGESYDTLDQIYAQKYPGKEIDVNDLRLMAVWLSGRLPINDDAAES